MAQKVNYTTEMTTQIVDAYSAGMDIAEIADSIGKTVRSIRSKLVRGSSLLCLRCSPQPRVAEPSSLKLAHEAASRRASCRCSCVPARATVPTPGHQGGKFSRQSAGARGEAG